MLKPGLITLTHPGLQLKQSRLSSAFKCGALHDAAGEKTSQLWDEEQNAFFLELNICLGVGW